MNYCKLLPLVMGVSLFGCADSHSLNVMEQSSNFKFSSDADVYVATSEDGKYGNHNYLGSGQMVSQAIKNELAVKINHVVVSNYNETYASALETAREKKFDYLVYPIILHWEDRATEWSAKPDKIKVKISIVDVQSESTMKSGIIEGKSGLATFGGDKPQDLLPLPMSEFISTTL